MSLPAQSSVPESALAAKYGPWALVTGASSGIGRAVASERAKAGVGVALVARRADALGDLARTLASDFGVSTRVIVADLASETETQRLDTETRDLDIGLVVAAAGFGTGGAFTEADIANELNMIDVNCRSLAQTAHDFAVRMTARGRGAIILMSSVFAFQGVPRAANYAATKAYVQTLAEGLARELRGRGVDVLASAPGPVMTGFAARAGMNIPNGATPEIVARASLAALGRGATVRPGLLAKALEAALLPLPRYFRTRILGLVTASMTSRENERPEFKRA